MTEREQELIKALLNLEDKEANQSNQDRFILEPEAHEQQKTYDSIKIVNLPNR